MSVRRLCGKRDLPFFFNLSKIASSMGAAVSLYSDRFIHSSEIYSDTEPYRDLGITKREFLSGWGTKSVTREHQ